jgi:lysyl oxidase
MRPIIQLELTAILALAACVADRPTAPVGPPIRGTYALARETGGTPNLIVDAARLANSWMIYDEDLNKQDRCSLIEGGVTPGTHRVLRFTVTTPNVGTADLAVGNPLDHIAANDGLFEFALCHAHFHFRHYATYELIALATGQPLTVRAAKRGFCMIDDTPWQSTGGVGKAQFDSCGTLAIPGNQGISRGWADSYDKHIGGQYFVLDGGDGQPAVPPGEYLLRVTVNPPFACTPADSLRPRDAQGACHNFVESDYDDNVGAIHIAIPDRAGKTATGEGP